MRKVTGTVMGALGAVSLLVAACTGDSSDAATPAATPASASTETATPTDAVLNPPTPAATPRGALAGLWLIDLASRERIELYQGDRYPVVRGFASSGDSLWVWIPEDEQYVRYDLQGREVDRSPTYPPLDAPTSHSCEQPDPAVSQAFVDGREYEVNCGVFSPDGLHMLYGVNVDDAGVPGGFYEAWVLHPETGERVLVSDQLRHCGGCDGRVGPSWSPSGRYVLVGETYGGVDSSVYLHDTETGETRKVAEGTSVNGFSTNVRWSPVEDTFLAPAEDGSAFVEHLPDGTRMAFPELPWPARFDPTGRVVYAPGGLYTLRSGAFDGIRETTIVVEAETGALLGSWPGAPATWPVERGVTWTPDGPAGLLGQVAGCDGTMLHHPLLAEPLCIAGARGAAFDPDAEHIAFARMDGAGGETARWDIVVREANSDSESVLGSYTTGAGRQPPVIRWHPEGTHLLVLWPGPDGI